MTEAEQKNCNACMDELKEVLKKFGCQLEIIVVFSSLHGPGFQVRTVPTRNIVVAQNIPKMGDN